MSAVVILGGGEAVRLPHKLEIDAGGVPLIVRVFRNVRSAGTVYVCASGTFPPEVDALLECPLLIDRVARGGPAQALLSGLPLVEAATVFIVAGDMPNAGAAAAAELQSHWEDGVEAVVPVNRLGRLEPLCALYDRAALLQALRDGEAASGRGGIASAVERLRAKRVQLRDERTLFGVNTPSDQTMLVKDFHCA